MASGTRRVYGGVTGEERVAERRRKLIEAGLNLFGSGGSRQVRVKDVVAAAGLTERYFYESFTDSDAFFEAVLDVTLQAVEAEVKAALLNAPEDGPARLAIALRSSVDQLVNDPRMIRIIFDDALGKGGRAGSRRPAENFLRWLGPDESLSDDRAMDARVKALALSGAASQLLISWAEGTLEISPAELADFLVGFCKWMNFY